MHDIARGHDSALLGAAMDARDGIHWSPSLRVDKYDDDMTAFARARVGHKPSGAELARLCKPFETIEKHGNLLTTAGLNRITSLIIGGGGTAVTNTTARIGVGDTNTAAAVGNTDLAAAAGSTHRWFQIMDATYPQQSNGVITLRATFATGDGNFAWAEVGTDVGTATVSSGNTVAALLLNRFVQSLGTKVSGSWVLTETITLS